MAKLLHNRKQKETQTFQTESLYTKEQNLKNDRSNQLWSDSSPAIQHFLPSGGQVAKS